MNKTTLNSQKEKHSTLSLRRATRYAVNQFPVTLISIHALLAESDRRHPGAGHAGRHFYPRSPCGERRGIFTAFYMDCQFLSTLSLRRATKPEERVESRSDISIHALLAESDSRARQTAKRGLYFYPRSPCGERRGDHGHMSGDEHFYPRSPCGERQVVAYFFAPHVIFLSTLSLRRATNVVPVQYRGQRISIHALLAESDRTLPQF